MHGDEDYSWVPLFRKSMNSQVFANEGLWKVWTWCLMKASATEQWVPIKTGRGVTEVRIMPGQFVYGRKQAAKKLRMKESTVRNRMKKLENMQNLDTQNNTHYSLVTLTNWERYRDLMKKRTGNRPINGQQTDTYKKKKKKKNIYAQDFLTFYEAYPKHTAKQPAFEAWQKLEKSEDMETLLPILLEAIQKQQKAKESIKASGGFVPEWPYPGVWLNNRRWEDEVEVKVKRYA